MVAAWYATVLWKFREWEFSLKERGIAQDRSDERCRDDLLRDAVLQVCANTPVLGKTELTRYSPS